VAQVEITKAGIGDSAAKHVQAIESRTICNHETNLVFIFAMGHRFVGHLVRGGHFAA
jgi:hypothetical protein